MNHIDREEHVRPGWFGHRKLTPRACIADSKKHLRTFLAESLEDLGFITSECGEPGDLDGLLDTELPDLLVLGVSVDGIEVGKILEVLVRREFGGKVLVIGQPNSIMVKAVRQIGDEYGIAMLPSLPTPFSAGSLRASLADAAAGRAGAKPRGRCRRGAEGRLARIVVSAEDRSSAPWFLAVPRRWCGCGIPPGAWCRRPTSFRKSAIRIFACAVRIRDRSRHRGLALSAGTARAGRSLDQPAGFVPEG